MCSPGSYKMQTTIFKSYYQIVFKSVSTPIHCHLCTAPHYHQGPVLSHLVSFAHLIEWEMVALSCILSSKRWNASQICRALLCSNQSHHFWIFPNNIHVPASIYPRLPCAQLQTGFYFLHSIQTSGQDNQRFPGGSIYILISKHHHGDAAAPCDLRRCQPKTGDQSVVSLPCTALSWWLYQGYPGLTKAAGKEPFFLFSQRTYIRLELSIPWMFGKNVPLQSLWPGVVTVLD